MIVEGKGLNVRQEVASLFRTSVTEALSLTVLQVLDEYTEQHLQLMSCSLSSMTRSSGQYGRRVGMMS